MPNIVAAFDGGAPGRHLVLNGHIDVFAVEDESRWTHGAWSAALVDGKIYGRGVADMKAGTAASIFAYGYLHRVRDQLKSRLTLTAVPTRRPSVRGAPATSWSTTPRSTATAA